MPRPKSKKSKTTNARVKEILSKKTDKERQDEFFKQLMNILKKQAFKTIHYTFILINKNKGYENY